MRMTRIRTAVSRENDRAIGEQTEAADKLVVTNGDTANSVLQEMSVGNTALATVGPSPYNDSTARIHSTHTQQRTTRRPPRHCCCSSHCPCACQSVCLYLCCSLSMSLSRLSPLQSRVWGASRSPYPTQHNDCIQHRTATQLSAAAAASTDDTR